METKKQQWKEDLIMYPSQCYCYFEADSMQYCIYLRWRGGDPWTAQLVPLLPNGRFGNYLEWEFLDVSDYVHDEYKNLEKECIRLIEKRFKNIIWQQRDS
jgi:hypothetical protein